MILIAIMMAIGIVSCSSDDNNKSYQETQQEYIKKMFEGMKGTYSGYLVMPDNSSAPVKFTIDNMANVNIASFPMDRILYEVYGSDYLAVKMSGNAISYSCPIDSVGFTGNYMSFVSKNDLSTGTIKFSYTKDGEPFNGYAFVTVKGLYNSMQKIVNVNFIVTDLTINQKDFTAEVCPINHNFEATKQD